MEMEVVGRHALLFDDDAMAAFVNSENALVEWNSLLIDRYDVRHLLSSPPPPRRRRNLQQSKSSSPPPTSSHESELDRERYLDLPPPPSDEQESDNAKSEEAGGVYNAVAFSYGNTNVSSDQKNADTGSEDSGFYPPFAVPKSLRQSLPPTEKLHQIIAKTAVFVSKHGGQSEIVLRVKQGNNPTFGFLMPDHHLHAYFRYLVDHQELLQLEHDEKKTDAKLNQMDGSEGGALTLLGSVYGSGEDEDGIAEHVTESKENVPVETVDPVGTAPVSHGSEKKELSASANASGTNGGAISKHQLPPKEKSHLLKKNSSSKAASIGNMKKDKLSEPYPAAAEKSQAQALKEMPKIETSLLEPPSDVKRLIDKIVEFILKNGKPFEAVLIEQDSKNGKFPFLLPSNQYHPYYLRVLQKAQQSKVSGHNFLPGNDSPDKKAIMENDIPYDYDRKEKFKMVIGKSKNGQEPPPSKSTQQPQFGVAVDAASAAAILQAATRGIKNPNLGFMYLNGQSSDLPSSQTESVTQKSDQNGNPTVSVPVAKAMARSAAIEAASEADSSEAHLTREQKLKAERLKRAKMFVSMLKSGAAPFKTEPSCGLSAEPQVSGISSASADPKEREGSSVPVGPDALDKNERSEWKNCGDEQNERRSKRMYRSRSKSNKQEEDEAEKDKDEDEKDRRHSRKKHRSHRSSREEIEEDEDEVKRDHKRSRKKHRSHHSSPEDELEEEEDEEEREHKGSRSKHRSRHSKHHSRDRHKRRRRHRHKHERSPEGESVEEEEEDRSKRKKIQSEKEELEEGEISSKISDQGYASREASVGLGNTSQATTQVSDDLRAKIRAMLMSTL